MRETTSYHAQAPQLPGRPERRPELRTILGPADASPESEDCLTLSVWTPDTGGGARSWSGCTAARSHTDQATAR